MSPTRHHWTEAEATRREALRAMGCICCRMNLARFNLRATGLAVEIHHVTDVGRQLGNEHICPLCAYHHRGICIPGMTSTAMRDAYGPSLAKGSKPFFEFYGDNASLLAITKRLERMAA